MPVPVHAAENPERRFNGFQVRRGHLPDEAGKGFTRRSVPELEKMLLAGGKDARTACSILRDLSPKAADAEFTLKRLLDDPRLGDYACEALLAIESTPSEATRKALVRLRGARLPT